MSDLGPTQLAPYVTGGAFLLAFIFGAVANKTDFCTMGAVSDWVNMGDFNRMRMWLLAIAVALLASSALHLAGAIDLSKSIYPGPNFTWLSYIAGGFLFGVGHNHAKDATNRLDGFVESTPLTERLEALLANGDHT